MRRRWEPRLSDTAGRSGTGEAEAALAELERAFEMGFQDFAALEASPYFEALRQDPRYGELVRRYQ